MCLVYKMHLSSVILFVSMQRWSESHFINSLTNFIELPSPPCSHPETICSKNILLTRILTPCFFEKKRGSNLAMLVLVSGGGLGSSMRVLHGRQGLAIVCQNAMRLQEKGVSVA